jgi:flagellar FliL protein
MAAAPKAKQDAGDAGKTESGSKKKLFMVIGLAIVLIAVSIGGTVVALKVLSPPPPAGEAVAAAAPAAAALAPAIYYELTPNFTINFTVNGRQRYLQAAITLLHRDPLLEPLLKLHTPAIRNGLVMLLSGKNFEELHTEEGKEALREEALEIIRGQLQKEREALIASGAGEKVSPANVEQVLFTHFVMQ